MESVPIIYRPKIISVFNHKGGVGKTTTTAGLGWKLAQQGKRVLLVDADPQCNLTGFMVDPGIALLPQQQRETLDLLDFDPINQFYLRHPNCNLLHALCPVLDITLAAARSLEAYKIHPATCFRVCDRPSLLPPGFAIAEHLSVPVPESLYLLAGHQKIGEWESKLTLACENPGSLEGTINIPGCFYQLLYRTAIGLGFEYVLVDLNPSGSTMNKLIVMSSYYFVVPCSPDYFSLMAISTLATMLPMWCHWMQTKCANLQDAPIKPPTHLPMFIGFTVQLYTVTNDGSGNPAAGFATWIRRLAAEVSNKLIPSLAKIGMASSVVSTPRLPNEQPGTLAKIRNYQSAGTASSQAHLPVFVLTDKVLRTITDSTHALGLVSVADSVFTQFAHLVMNHAAKIPEAERMRVERLQQAVRMVWNHNYQLPDDERTILAIADHIARTPQQLNRNNNNNNNI